MPPGAASAYGLTQLKDAFTARLERVRGTMSDAEFAALVDDITRTAARLEENRRARARDDTRHPDVQGAGDAGLGPLAKFGALTLDASCGGRRPASARR